MKTKHLLPALAVVALAIVGCLPSVQPLYTDKDLIFKKELVGAWGEGESDSPDEDRWKFSRDDSARYKLEMRDSDGRKGEMYAHLVSLKSGLYLDLQPDPEFLEKKAADWYQFALVQGHVFFKIHKIGEKELKMSMTDYDWLGDYLETNPQSLAHYKQEDRLVLTATTAELQAFIAKHDDKFWDEPAKMIRQKD